MKTCAVKGCDKPHHGRGWCQTHYRRWKRNGDPLVKSAPTQVCTIEGCDKPHLARGWCGSHYAKWKRSGNPLGTKKQKRTPVCTVKGCDKPHKGRGLCNMHYNRVARYGSLELQRGPVECGTLRGYDRHRKRGEATCQPCREAVAADSRRRRAKAKALRAAKPIDYTAGTCTDCQRPMVKRRTPKDQIPDGHIRAYNKDVCTGCIKRTRETNPDANAEYLARQQERAKAMDPALAAMMRRREERLAKEARRKLAAQILANQGRRPAA